MATGGGKPGWRNFLGTIESLLPKSNCVVIQLREGDGVSILKVGDAISMELLPPDPEHSASSGGESGNG